MQARRVPVSLQEFARQMRRKDDVLAERVQCFEAARGKMDDDGLAVAAQANYVCWFESTFPESLVAACRAIGSGRPQRMNLCLQISPERWRELHHYLVAVQRWLGDPRPVPEVLQPERVARLRALLGERTGPRVALAELYLSTLVEHLLDWVSFSQLSGDGTTDGGVYDDFSTWYTRTYGRRHQEHQAPDLTEQRSMAVRRSMADRPSEAEELLQGLLRPSQPPCGQRFLRYQDIRLASIGALRWRGDLPPDDVPRSYWEGLFRDAGDALDQWIANRSPATELGGRIHGALGRHTPQKLDLVTMFLKTAPGWDAMFYWLEETARQSGMTPCTAFRDAP